MARVEADAGPTRWRRDGLSRTAIVGLLVLGSALFAATAYSGQSDSAAAAAARPTTLGLNLFGLANYNRQQVYLNMISQSEWFSSRGREWTPMSAAQLDEHGWVKQLESGQTAPRPLTLPPAGMGDASVRCEYRGRGRMTAGGIARITSQAAGAVTLTLSPTGSAEDGAWIELVETDPADPVRDIDCRETAYPREARFHPAFLEFLKGFKTVRFLDWQKINDNKPVSWAARPTLASTTQVGPSGAAIEDMIDLANQTGIDPWFLIPYQADEAYIIAFAQLVHKRLKPERTVYVELGNEVWNDMFDAAQQARREGVELKLGGGDAKRAQMIRYAQKVRETMKIWTATFSDRPRHLVRVAASQHAWPDLARYILEDEDTANWVDALATAPYIWVDLNGKKAASVDAIFAAMPGAVDDTMAFAEQNRAIARQYGKRFIAYEGGQHIVTADLTLARALQRDPRMADMYRYYLNEWDKRMGDTLMLYASSAPIADYGSWGLIEYAGQPMSETPKLRAVRDFQKGKR